MANGNRPLPPDSKICTEGDSRASKGWLGRRLQRATRRCCRCRRQGQSGQFFLPKRLAGAGGENRTLDLPLTKGLRYHYATPASGAQKMGFGPKGALLYPSHGQRERPKIHRCLPKIPPPRSALPPPCARTSSGAKRHSGRAPLPRWHPTPRLRNLARIRPRSRIKQDRLRACSLGIPRATSRVKRRFSVARG